MEERLFLKDHASEHAAQRPDVEGVVVSLQVDQQFWTLEVAGSHSHVVFLVGMVELGKTPIDKAQTLVGVVNHDVVWLHVSVHNTFAMAVIESLKYFINIEPNVQVSEALVESSEVHIASVNVLHDKSWRLGHWVPNHVDKVDNVDSASEGLQNLYFSSDLGFLDWFEDFDHNAFVVDGVDPFIDFGILASADLLDDLVVVLRATIQIRLAIGVKE